MQRPVVTAIGLIASAESATFCAFYFKYINKQWEYFHLLGIIMCLLALLSICFMPESPRWLISSGKYKQAFDVYKRIAKVNGAIFTHMIYKLSRNNASDESTRENLDPN